MRGKYELKGNVMIENKNIPNLVSEYGCNWFQAKNGDFWKEEGVYSNETLSNEYENFGSTKGSEIILYRQHFDVGMKIFQLILLI